MGILRLRRKAMTSILLSLLCGWFLKLFAFHTLIIGGMLELFSIEITIVGYYAIFGIIGMIRYALYRIGDS